jgi:hypothetical protein
MKKNILIIITLAAVSVIGLGSVLYATSSNGIKSYAEGTSFQGHSDGKYGPPGAGGYGSPVPVEIVEEAPPVDKGAKKRPLFQDITEGTSFQDHSEGKYGPVGDGGYGPPESLENTTGETE